MRLIDADHLDKRIYEEIPLKEFGTIKRMARMREIIAEEPTVGGWISVEDRLPERDGQYLCITRINGRNYHQIHLWHGGEWRWVPDVRFWMELPPMPEEVQT